MNEKKDIYKRIDQFSIVKKKLLSNQNYVSKAPKELVENEKTTLEKEKQELELILSKIN